MMCTWMSDIIINCYNSDSTEKMIVKSNVIGFPTSVYKTHVTFDINTKIMWNTSSVIQIRGKFITEQKCHWCSCFLS